MRTTSLAPDALRRIHRDPRFREALGARRPVAGWRDQGECLRFDPEVFFPTPVDDPAPAVAICAGCQVRGSCLAEALETGECEGVWGGTTPEERRVMRRAWLRPVPGAD